MHLKAIKTDLKEILYLRRLFLQENNFQIRYNSCHERGWSDSYLLTLGDVHIGYGAVKGKDELSKRDAVFEFYVMPAWRKHASSFFEKLITIPGVKYIECQSNDLLLSSMMYEFADQISSDVVLFEDGPVTSVDIPGAIFRLRKPDEHLFEHKHEPDGDYVLEASGTIVGTCGFLLHYNVPFADLYMEVREDQRRKGFGSLMIQEVKTACYSSGRVPAARCNISNKASKATLLKGGLKVAGYMLSVEIKSVLL
jgi:GNAT superfamily N-acetyltransferase